MQGIIHLFDRLPQVDTSYQAANDHVLSPVRTKPLIGLIHNRHSHRNAGANFHANYPDQVIATAPRKRSELAGILANFADKRVDCIAIDGGDGTVRDVLTCGIGVFGDNWPPIIVLPAGKTNALAIDLGIPTDWSLASAMEAMKAGNVVRRQPLVVTQRDNPSAQVRGFILGGGAFNRCIALGQRSHDLGAFNAAVVGVTAIWSIAQALFGGANNPWRKGTRMRVRHSDGSEVPHNGGLPADERFLLFASTLERLPAGINPFRRVDAPLKLALLDNSSRSLLLRIGSVLRGTAGKRTQAAGAHLIGDTGFDVELGDSFILDGEAFPAGDYHFSTGVPLQFVVP